MATQPDLRLYGRDGHLALIADIRARQGTSPEWAALLRQNLVEHDELPAVEFFLIATPDQMYLWKGAGKDLSPILPTYVFDSRLVLKPYYESTRFDAGRISKEVFELLVTAWLSELANWRELPAGSEGEQSWIKDSNLLDVIKNGRIELPQRGVNVYVESNFVIELALAQEQSFDCERILHFCEQRLEAVQGRLLKSARVIPLESSVWLESSQCKTRFGLASQDAIVCASILDHLKGSQPVPSCFLTRDNDFRDPDQAKELNRYDCKLLSSFGDGFRYISRPR